MRLEKEIVIWYSNSRLIYTIFYGDKELDRRYEEGGIYVNVNKPQTFVLPTSYDLRDSGGRSDHTVIVHEVFNPLPFII